MNKKLTQVLCWMMAIALPVTVMAADAAPAMLACSGTVTVNGAAVPASHTVYPGDEITTAAGASVTLKAKGLAVTLPAESSVTYGNKQVDLRQGRALVTTGDAAMTAHIANLTVSPASKNTRFQVTRTKETVALAAFDGAVKVSDGKMEMVLPAGQMLLQTKDDETTPPAGTKKSSFSHWVIGGIIAAAVGGAIAGVAVSEGGPASPSRP